MVDDMNPDSDEDDDWTKYADTGYTSTYDPWADMVPATEIEEEEFDDEFNEFGDEEFRRTDIPRCPAPAGIEHTIRMGTCNHCLGRVAGVRIAGDPLATVGERVRNQALERDPDLKVNDDIDCCPFCEDLFIEIDLIVKRIAEGVSDVEFSKAQLGYSFCQRPCRRRGSPSLDNCSHRKPPTQSNPFRIDSVRSHRENTRDRVGQGAP